MSDGRELLDLTRDCVHCGFCLPSCPTYVLWQEEMDSPRGRIQLMEHHVAGGGALPAVVVEHVDRCLGCLACVSSCPSGVRYDLLIEETRARVEEAHPRTRAERLQRRVLFATLPHPRRMALALRLAPLGRALPSPAWARPMLELAVGWRSHSQAPAHTPAAGDATRGRVGLLTGCVQQVMFGDVNAATARVLAAAGYDVVAPRQSCCGALSAHAGRAEEAAGFTERLRSAFADLDPIVVNSSGCGSHLKEKGLPALDVTEALADAELPTLHPLELTVAYQDSCHMRHAQRLPGAWRPLLERIPGLHVVEPAEQDVCCGSAGTYNVTQPEAARALGDRKAAHVRATGADVLASANPGCLVQVAQALGRVAAPLPALHPVELLDASIRSVAAHELVADARR
ncbi:MAG: (Fe-S)-binding protein [Gaiella sp.]